MDKANDRSLYDESEDSRKHTGESANKDSNKQADSIDADEPNPARTTKGKFTAPKFGSAGSGGAELEPGPETD